MLCMTQYICAPLQSAGGFILEGDWTPTKTKLLQLTTYRGGSLISFQDKRISQCEILHVLYETSVAAKLHNRTQAVIWLLQ